jgi:DNA-binding CsgD family transcriptional regulator
MKTCLMHSIAIAVLCLLCACSSFTNKSAEGYYRQGRALREADDPVGAMKAFIAATRVHSNEYTYKGRAYSNMATMCRICERHEQAYSLYVLSAGQFALAEDSLAYAYALNNMAWEQAVMGCKELAVTLADSAEYICPDEAVRVKTTESRAAACLYAGQYDSVLYYTQKIPIKSVYFDMLRAQSYTFIGLCDSALYYACNVIAQTDNGRYLDDLYYILTHCDSTATADDIRALAAARTDIQCTLERNRTDWIQASWLAQEAYSSPDKSMNRAKTVLLCSISLLVLGLGIYYGLLLRKSRQVARAQSALLADRENELELQCKALRRSNRLRTELQWYDYEQFCLTCNSRLSGIADKLKERGFAEREMRISILVMIGLSYAEIADILYRAESGIGKDKYVIAKRLGVRAKDLQATLRAIACSN